MGQPTSRLSTLCSMPSLIDQVGEGGLPDGACRPVLMDYAERYAASFEDSEGSYANQMRLLACVVCGEKAKAEQYAEAAIRARHEAGERGLHPLPAQPAGINSAGNCCRFRGKVLSLRRFNDIVYLKN